MMTTTSPLLPFLLLCACAHTQEAVERARDQGALVTLGEEIHSLAHGRDGGPEDVLWAASPGAVWAIDGAGQAAVVWSPPRFTRILHLEAAQLDDDAPTEWVVILDGGRIRSEVVEWDGVRKITGKPWFGFARPAWDGEKTRLLGQKAGGERPFWGHIEWLDRDGDGALVPSSDLGVQDSVNLFEVHPGASSGGMRILAFEPSGQLAERSAQRPKDVLWRSDDRPVGRPVVADRSYTNLLGEERGEVLSIPPPPEWADLDGDGALDLLVAGNPGPPVRVFENLLALQGGDLRFYQWKERGVLEVRRTQLVGRAVTGVAAWTWRGRPVWVAAVWTRLRGGFAPAETRLLLFDPATGEALSADAAGAATAGPETPSPVLPAASESEATPPAGSP